MHRLVKHSSRMILALLIPVFLSACGSGDSATATAVFSGHSAVLDNFSTVRTWGAGGFGQLGNNSFEDRLTPVSAGTGYSQVAIGGSHTVALKTDTSVTPNTTSVWAWGNNVSGQLGNNTVATSRVPVQVVSAVPLTGISAVAAGGRHSLALTDKGEVFAWGGNDKGQLGDNTTANRGTAAAVSNSADGTFLKTPIIAIAAGGEFSLALANDGKVWAWGNSEKGQLGVPIIKTSSLIPVQVEGFSVDTVIIKIAAGGSHALAIDSTGKIWAWGFNFFGQLGDGKTKNLPSAVQIDLPTGTALATDISAGLAHSLAVIDGRVYGWGYNFYGQVGNGATLKSDAPNSSPVALQASPGFTLPDAFTSVIAGGYHSIAKDIGGNFWTWGRNSYGQLGDGTTDDRSTARQISLQ